MSHRTEPDETREGVYSNLRLSIKVSPSSNPDCKRGLTRSRNSVYAVRYVSNFWFFSYIQDLHVPSILWETR